LPQPVAKALPDASIRNAAIELRKYVQASQPRMAVALGVSMAALRTYESGSVKTPEARAILAYLSLAEEADRKDLMQVFGSALQTVLGIRSDALIEQLRKIKPTNI
jgi:transcriptional regulator with XRE-family HTH domain